MTSNDAVVAVIDALTEARIPYMLAGSYSSNYYGVARSTHDADFVIQTTPEVLLSLFKSLAGRLTIDPQISFEGVTGTYRHVARVDDGLFKIEFFYLTDDPFDQSRFARRVPVESLGRTVFIPTPEDVVVMKMRWLVRANRPRDLGDVKNVIGVQRQSLDWTYVEGWCEQHGSLPLLHELIKASS